MKKITAIALIVFILCSLGMNTFAAVPETVVPMWNNIRGINNLLNFNGTSGTADISIFGKSGATKITATATVYVQTSTGWDEVESNSGSSTSTYLLFDVSFTGIPGEYYKSVLNVTVTINGVSETETVTSYETCPVTPSN